MTPSINPIVKFVLGAGVLVMLIIASQVEMPLQAILVAVAFSDLILLLILQFGPSVPDKRRPD
ncbi:MAG: hypothetical protein M9934_13950 [Thermomicrobiales bacterium]|nr:hypothetical protein [Thermomicrobiales bacterium]MCO5217969.1 hypothetical protein [Thermomicrobiales bacterium]MCO5229368.1 hypothetical protein [Thermomicrobiales bacterium]